MAELQPTDKILVNRGGIDYQTDVVPLLFPEAPGDGNVHVRNGQTKSWVRGLPYDIRTLPELP